MLFQPARASTFTNIAFPSQALELQGDTDIADDPYHEKLLFLIGRRLRWGVGCEAVLLCLAVTFFFQWWFLIVYCLLFAIRLVLYFTFWYRAEWFGKLPNALSGAIVVLGLSGIILILIASFIVLEEVTLCDVHTETRELPGNSANVTADYVECGRNEVFKQTQTLLSDTIRTWAIANNVPYPRHGLPVTTVFSLPLQACLLMGFYKLFFEGFRLPHNSRLPSTTHLIMDLVDCVEMCKLFAIPQPHLLFAHWPRMPIGCIMVANLVLWYSTLVIQMTYELILVASDEQRFDVTDPRHTQTLLFIRRCNAARSFCMNVSFLFFRTLLRLYVQYLSPLYSAKNLAVIVVELISVCRKQYPIWFYLAMREFVPGGHRILYQDAMRAAATCKQLSQAMQQALQKPVISHAQAHSWEESVGQVGMMLDQDIPIHLVRVELGLAEEPSRETTPSRRNKPAFQMSL